MSKQYYDGTKLLSLMDINGNRPEIYICTTNRTGGKTTYFSRLLVNKYLQNKEKFCLIYRFNYELDNVSEKFFKDINTLFFPEYEMTSKRQASGIFHELFLNDFSCGYAVSLNSADQIKKYSHLFSDVARMLFDEFQSESNHYCNNEIEKLLSIHTSIARGQGKHVRYVPVYMIGNPVSIINPYYVELGISSRLKTDTKFLRGDGFVLEQGYIDTASKAQKESGFNRAFAKNKYANYASEAVYLNDNLAFVESVSGKSRYICTIKYNDCNYGIREYSEQGIMYCDDRPDMSFPTRITTTTSDHGINYVMLQRHDMYIANLRLLFEKGCFRFRNLKCKEAVLSALKYN
jgi:hypothetical protein